MPEQQRYKLTVAYRGTAYHGWQWQPHQDTYTKGPVPPEGHGIPTIEQHLTQALKRVVGHPLTVVGSSRTDAKVHAKGQVVHFDTIRTQIPPENIRRATNHTLPDDILIRSIEPVPDTFSAVGSTPSSVMKTKRATSPMTGIVARIRLRMKRNMPGFYRFMPTSTRPRRRAVGPSSRR